MEVGEAVGRGGRGGRLSFIALVEADLRRVGEAGEVDGIRQGVSAV